MRLLRRHRHRPPPRSYHPRISPTSSPRSPRPPLRANSRSSLRHLPTRILLLLAAASSSSSAHRHHILFLLDDSAAPHPHRRSPCQIWAACGGAVASFSDNFNTPTPTVSVKILTINWFHKEANGNEEVSMTPDAEHLDGPFVSVHMEHKTGVCFCGGGV